MRHATKCRAESSRPARGRRYWTAVARRRTPMRSASDNIIDQPEEKRQETFDVRTKKRCKRCRMVKPREAFHLASGRPDGLQPWCQECQRAHMRAYDSAHRDMHHHAKAAYRARRAGGRVVEFVQRSVVYARDNWQCWTCGEPVDPEREWPDPMSASLDHVVPLVQRGEHSYNNVRLAHVSCNLARRASRDGVLHD